MHCQQIASVQNKIGAECLQQEDGTRKKIMRIIVRNESRTWKEKNKLYTVRYTNVLGGRYSLAYHHQSARTPWCTSACRTRFSIIDPWWKEETLEEMRLLVSLCKFCTMTTFQHALSEKICHHWPCPHVLKSACPNDSTRFKKSVRTRVLSKFEKKTWKTYAPRSWQVSACRQVP